MFFEFDDDKLTPNAKTVLTKVIRDAKQAKITQVMASGHTDRAGNQDYNTSLSKRRAEAVMSYLLESGLAKAKVLTDAHGEDLSAIGTEDGMQDGRNHRVEIMFSK